MKHSFGYYEGRDVPYPIEPNRPKIPINSTSAQLRELADHMQAYEAELSVYQEKVVHYHRVQNARTDQFIQDLHEESEFVSRKQFDFLYSEAYDSGHSAGYEEVYGYFFKYLYMVQKFNEVGK